MSKLSARRITDRAVRMTRMALGVSSSFMRKLIRVLASPARPVFRLLFLAFVTAVCVLGTFNAAAFFTALPRAFFVAPAPTPLFTDRDGAYLSDMPDKNGAYGFWELPLTLPSRLVACVVASEDRRFRSHPGVDPASIVRAVASTVGGNLPQGASTIAMQVARLQNPADRTLGNKLIETYAALLFTLRYGRDGVLRQYFTLAPQGNGMFGFSYSARRYFRKPVDDLSWAESALLTAIVKAPGRLDLFDYIGFSRAKKRAEMILGLAYRQGYLEGESYGIALTQLADLRRGEKETRPENSYHFILRLLAEAEKTADADPLEGRTAVRASLDLSIQSLLKSTADYAMSRFRYNGAGNIALVAADAHSGEVLGYVGSQDYYDGEHKGSINYAATPRPIASTVKPFLYALGLMRGDFTPASVLADLPFHVLSPSGEYSAGNFDSEYMGPMLYRKALSNSRNIPALRVLETVGLDNAYGFLKKLRIVQGDEPPEYYGYGLALGGVYASLEALVEAYGALANDGKRFELRWTKTSDELSSQTESFQDREYLISEAAARQISMFLSDPLARLPSFSERSSMDSPFPIALKTGTSPDYRDAWTIAFSSKYLVGVWIGDADNEKMQEVSGSVAAGLAQRIFISLEPEKLQGIDESPFPPPRNSVPLRICTLSGERASELCSEVSIEYFEEGSEVHTFCSIHRAFAVDGATGALASGDCPPGRVQLVTRAVFPPQYSLWAHLQGYPSPPAALEAPEKFEIDITSPLSGSQLLIDPEMPRKFQSVPLRAEVYPPVPALVWYVDGEQFAVSSYPYEVRWPLAEGDHTFQAKFARANVYSAPVRITIDSY